MKNQYRKILSILIMLGILLSACGGGATPVVEPTAPPAEPTVAPVEPTAAPEPTATPISYADESQLDEGFGQLLSTMEKYNTLGMDQFAGMLADNPQPFLLDVRQPSEVEEKGYIEGAVLIPLRELGQNLDKLPSFDTTIVSYCGSGWRCTIAMTALEAMGWNNVLSLKDNSFGGWVEAGYAVASGMPAEPVSLNAAAPDPAMVMSMDRMFSSIPEGWGVVTAEQMATDLAEKPNTVIIDVRTLAEVEEKGAIANSIHIPLQQFIELRAEWPADTEAPVIIYCGSGHRSTMAMTIMWAYGYQDVRSLKGGIAAWAGAGYPVEGGTASDPEALLDGAYQTFLADMEKYNTVGLDDLNASLAEEPPPFVLDVRQPEEAEEKGHIESAVLIPLRELGQNLDLLPSFDTQIVSYCGSGWRCTIAMTALEAMGWTDVLSLKGGSFGGWVEAGYAVEPGLPPQADSLDVAEPDPALVTVFDQALAAIPEGWGVATIEGLATELLEKPELILIDVRTQAEIDEKGVIEAANLFVIPLEEFITMKADWPADKDAEIVIYCGSGHRSTIAMTMLWSYGYTNVRSMKGGFSAWADAGYPVAELANQ